MKEKYILKDHAEIKELSLKWWEQKPEQPGDLYEYAVLQYRVKDFEAAVRYLRRAVEGGVISAYYLYAYCLYYGLGTKEDKKQADQYFRKYLEAAKESGEPEDIYRRAMCYAKGFGTEPEEGLARKLFMEVKDTCEEAMYELGCAYRDGTLGLTQNVEKAIEYLWKADDNYAEYAVFALYDIYRSRGEAFPDMKKITEAYSYQIGKYARVVHVNPSLQAYQNLADLYLKGFPGDTGEDDARFRRKAEKYIKKIREFEQNL